MLDITFATTISGVRDLFINHIFIDELQTSTNTNMQMINSNLSKLTGDITLKLLDIKKEYIEEIKNIISLNSSNLNEKMREITDKIKETIERNNIVLTNDISNKLDKSNLWMAKS